MGISRTLIFLARRRKIHSSLREKTPVNKTIPVLSLTSGAYWLHPQIRDLWVPSSRFRASWPSPSHPEPVGSTLRLRGLRVPPMITGPVGSTSRLRADRLCHCDRACGFPPTITGTVGSNSAITGPAGSHLRTSEPAGSINRRQTGRTRPAPETPYARRGHRARLKNHTQARGYRAAKNPTQSAVTQIAYTHPA